MRVGGQRLHLGVFACLRVERGAVVAEQPVLALAVLLELHERVGFGQRGMGGGHVSHDPKTNEMKLTTKEIEIRLE